MPPGPAPPDRRARAQVALAMVAAMLAAALIGAGVGQRLYPPVVGVTGAVVCGLSAGLFLAYTVRKARRRPQAPEAAPADSSDPRRGDSR